MKVKLHYFLTKVVIYVKVVVDMDTNLVDIKNVNNGARIKKLWFFEDYIEFHHLRSA